RACDVDAWCDRYEADWKAGRRPRIEGFLADAPEPIRADLLPELVALDVALRREAGERPTPGGYRSHFPGLPRRLDAILGVPGAESPTQEAGEGTDLETWVDLPETRVGPRAREPGAGLPGKRGDPDATRSLETSVSSAPPRSIPGRGVDRF